MTTNNPQKDYIDKLQKISISPLLCSNAYLKQENNQYVPGKRYALNKHVLKDYLTVGSNQIVFELDAKSYAANYEFAKKIIEVLQEKNIPFYIFSSGGKGIHIEIWFESITIKNAEIKSLYKKAISYGLSYKHIRLWLWNLLLDNAGIPEELRGAGKILDSSCITFDDLHDKSKLLRVAGGRKILKNKVTGENVIFYKTFLPSMDFNKKQVKLKDFKNVRYPVYIEMFTIDEYDLSSFLDEYCKRAQELTTYQAKNINLKESGGYTNLNSVKQIREGLNEGQRALGAQILSIAMACDKLPEPQQESILKEYAENCSQVGSPYTYEDAFGWLKWVREQEEVFWNCSLTILAGVHDENLCEYCRKQHKEAYKFLERTTILDQIKTYLDHTIIGEDNTKMLMFLLMLSKDFPSKTGTPDWNITGDPTSQNIILASDSSSGKSYITKQIMNLFGDQGKDYLFISRITSSAFNYLTEENMDGKILFIEEMQGLDEKTEQLRVWMSEGQVNLMSVEREKQIDGTEKNVIIHHTTKGQPVFITNQAEGAIGEQLLNRSWVLGTDTSKQQTQKIIEYQAKVAKGAEKSHELEKRAISDSLKLLKSYHFIVPYADIIKDYIPMDEVRARRDFDKFLTLIKCSAYLHQMQRPILVDQKSGREYLVCVIKDYEIALEYSSGILGATFSGLTTSQIDLINFLKKSTFKEEFTIRLLMKEFGKTQPYWYGQLKQLEDLGYISVERSIGKESQYCLNEEKVINVIKLPSAEKMRLSKTGDLLQSFSNKKYDFEKVKKAVVGDFVNNEKTKELEDSTYNNFQNIDYANFNQDSWKNHHRNPGSIIGQDTKKAVLEFIIKNEKHLVEEQEIFKNFELKDKKEITESINQLVITGKIMEPKPKRFVAL